MDRKELNQENIELGKQVLVGLDRDNFPVAAAFWLLDAESTSWKYILASSVLDSDGPINAYNKLISELQKILGKDNTFAKAVSLVSPNNALIKLLRVAINTGPSSVAGIRFTGNAINNQYIDDAYLYRVS